MKRLVEVLGQFGRAARPLLERQQHGQAHGMCELTEQERHGRGDRWHRTLSALNVELVTRRRPATCSESALNLGQPFSDLRSVVRGWPEMDTGLRGCGRGQSTSRFVCARSDAATFAEVYVEYHERVLRFFARRSLDPETAFDLMAETFAEMLAGIGGFRGQTEEQGRAWMWTIARHQLFRW